MSSCCRAAAARFGVTKPINPGQRGMDERMIPDLLLVAGVNLLLDLLGRLILI